ncbi:MAG: hypothetical protein GX913_03465 [Clostridiales bacterium]|nr:hypothetical protein [Clostridiales bacterium]
MSDSFGKIFSILLAVVLMFLVPVQFYLQRQENLKQVYIMTETVYLVDAVRNKGRLTINMYETYLNKIRLLGGLYETDLQHVHLTHKSPEERYIVQEDSYYTRQITEALYKEGEYLFDLGDFFQMEVSSVKNKIETPLVYYGGSIKYEID